MSASPIQFSLLQNRDNSLTAADRSLNTWKGRTVCGIQVLSDRKDRSERCSGLPFLQTANFIRFDSNADSSQPGWSEEYEAFLEHSRTIFSVFVLRTLL